MDGTSLESDLPLHWSTGSNVLWKVEVPGVGHASPIVFGENVYLATANLDNQERSLLCYGLGDGSLKWDSLVLKAPLERKHSLNSFASSTPATDGHHLFVAFLDRDQMFVAAYGLDGKQSWSTRPGPFASMHGFCSSPVLYRDLVILNGDHDGDSYLVALNKSDGTIAWKTSRDNHTRSYCVPLIRVLKGKTQMILSGDICVASYDPSNGKRHWVVDGPTEQFVASPVFSEETGLVYITGGFPDHHILAIDPGGTGNVTQTHIVWRTTEGVSYVPSPILVNGLLFTIADSGVAHCFEARSGKLLWKQRFGEEHASLVAAQNRIYFLNDKGTMNIVQAASDFIPLAKNEIGEKCFASPALSQGRIILRGEKSLFCISTRR
jgi:outer membrane protein assembly factor BamB